MNAETGVTGAWEHGEMPQERRGEERANLPEGACGPDYRAFVSGLTWYKSSP